MATQTVDLLHEDLPPAQRMSALRADIDRYSNAYYVLDEPLIPDVDFDKVFRALEALELEHPELARADSPTQKVGGAAQSSFAPEAYAEASAVEIASASSRLSRRVGTKVASS